MSWTVDHPAYQARKVRCPLCGAPRLTRCRHNDEPVGWTHLDRQILAGSGQHLGGPRRKLPAEVRQWAAEGVPMKEIARRTGIAHTTLIRHGVRSAR